MAIATAAPHAASRPGDDIYLAGIEYAIATIEDLAADADIAARVFFRAKYPTEILEAEILPTAASTGVDGSNTLTVTVRNVTQSVDIATVVSTTNLALNTPVALTVTAANRFTNADDVIGIVVTQGTTANTAGFLVQVTHRSRQL